MKNIFHILISAILFISCNTKGTDEPNLSKIIPPLPEVMTKEEKVNSDIKSIFKLLNDDIVKTSIDSNGYFSFDMGAASVGRVTGNLKEVNVSIQYLPEQPGCADICPEMALIIFKCKFGIECVSDPYFTEIKSKGGTISLVNLDTASLLYDLLKRIQSNL